MVPVSFASARLSVPLFALDVGSTGWALHSNHEVGLTFYCDRLCRRGTNFCGEHLYLRDIFCKAYHMMDSKSISNVHRPLVALVKLYQRWRFGRGCAEVEWRGRWTMLREVGLCRLGCGVKIWARGPSRSATRREATSTTTARSATSSTTVASTTQAPSQWHRPVISSRFDPVLHLLGVASKSQSYGWYQRRTGLSEWRKRWAQLSDKVSYLFLGDHKNVWGILSEYGMKIWWISFYWNSLNFQSGINHLPLHQIDCVWKLSRNLKYSWVLCTISMLCAL